MGIFNKMTTEYFYEKNLGSFFLVLHKGGIEQDIIDKIKLNEQSFVTAYDIYDTLLSIGYDCYDDNCWKKINNKSKNGKSVFSLIDGKNRNCNFYYSEIKDNECFCYD